MKEVVVRGLTIGSGRPKICVPIVGRTEEEVLQAGRAIACCSARGADLCEWRIDWFDRVWNFSELVETGRKLREALGNLPLLVTFRTKSEGGERECDPSRYTELVVKLCAAEIADLVDIELFTGGCRVAEMSGAAALHGIKTVFSSHDFEKTPPESEIIARLRQMEEMGADIAKIAVMPKTPADVLTLLSATEKRSSESGIPLVTMSMGALGAVSRVCGELTGSSITFGSLGRASAPGQIGAEELLSVLELFSIG